MAKKPSPSDEIAARIKAPGPSSWEHRVADEHKATLQAIKADFLAGRFGASRRPAAKAIADWLAENGIATIGLQGVESWLKK